MKNGFCNPVVVADVVGLVVVVVDFVVVVVLVVVWFHGVFDCPVG